jgi:hypothetical protein
MLQDNLSTMLLEKNGKQSSSKRTQHIRVRYFFIEEHVTCGDLTINHYPTAGMIGDHFTKPLQGALFRKFQVEIQGIPFDTSDADLGWYHEQTSEAPVTIPQECIGTDDIPYGR